MDCAHCHEYYGERNKPKKCNRCGISFVNDAINENPKEKAEAAIDIFNVSSLLSIVDISAEKEKRPKNKKRKAK
jgi:hypothetical protein